MQEETNNKSKQKMILNRFTERILMITLPTAMCLLLLAVIEEIDPFVAVITFGTVVMVTILIIIPFMEQLQSVADYSKKVSDSIKKGEEIPQFMGSPPSEEYANIIEAINQVHNIWSTKHEELKAAYISDSAILDVLPDPLMLLGNSGEIVGANLEARKLFGPAIREKELADFINNDAFLAYIKDVIADKNDKKSFEMVIDKPAKILLVKAEKLPAEAHSGAVTALVFHDITEARKFEQMQADFVANASHELRTPLSVISGFVETLEGPAKDDKEAQEKFLSIMGEQCQRMSRLIENLLSLSRAQMQNKTSLEKINLKDLIAGLVLGMEALLKRHNMTVKVMVNHTPLILGTPSEVTQIFQNLLDNAIKYGIDGGIITIKSHCENKLSPEANFVYVSINNKGDVIPAELIPRISERFYRVDTEKTRNRSGSGLGLAIVRQILEKHGGKMEITSTEKDGTTFTVPFPIVGDEEQKDSKGKDRKKSALNPVKA